MVDNMPVLHISEGDKRMLMALLLVITGGKPLFHHLVERVVQPHAVAFLSARPSGT